jgi:hypothetical protein
VSLNYLFFGLAIFHLICKLNRFIGLLFLNEILHYRRVRCSTYEAQETVVSTGKSYEGGCYCRQQWLMVRLSLDHTHFCREAGKRNTQTFIFKYASLFPHRSEYNIIECTVWFDFLNLNHLRRLV